MPTINERNYQLIAFTEDGLSLDVEKETMWLTQAEMGELFGVNVDTIDLHLRNIYREEELETSTYEESSVVRFESNVRKTHFANADRPTALYGLDMIPAVGCRADSKRGIVFRRWRTRYSTISRRRLCLERKAFGCLEPDR